MTRTVAAGSAVARIGALTVAALALAHLHVRWRPATICPLRAVTGIPCPLCGGTTAVADLGRLELLGALRAAPVPLLAALAIVTAPLGTAAAWWRASPRTRAAVLAAGLIVAEGWQLVRFGFV